MFEDDEQSLCLSSWEGQDILVLNTKSKQPVNSVLCRYSNTKQCRTSFAQTQSTSTVFEYR